LKSTGDPSVVELHPHPRSHLILGGIAFASLVITIITIGFCLRNRRKKITVVAQKSFIIKKKIILEKADSDKTNDSIIPLVKIDYMPIEVDIGSESHSNSSQYELPLDPLWEVDRNRFKIFILFINNFNINLYFRSILVLF
jgi:hypothetical protein